eukprot:m.105356 g.105356  ORF g.105356 m.105356 type:complete len:107 (-) comp21009_c0_seq1:26-346(-)
MESLKTRKKTWQREQRPRPRPCPTVRPLWNQTSRMRPTTAARPCTEGRPRVTASSPPEDDADKGVEAAPASDDSKVTATRTGSDSDQVTDAPTEAVAKPTDSMDTT